jgi:hypothetical protein
MGNGVAQINGVKYRLIALWQKTVTGIKSPQKKLALLEAEHISEMAVSTIEMNKRHVTL